MASRALHLREALAQWFNDVESQWFKNGSKPSERPSVLDDRLSPSDWQVITAIEKILTPFEIASKQLQGDGIAGKRSTSGSFDEYFSVIEMLMDHLEDAINGTVYEEDADKNMARVDLFKNMQRKTRRLLKVYIKLAWKKLDKYYSLLTPTAYVAAVIFHPCKKWTLLEQLWNRLPARQTQGWRRRYDASLRDIWEESYKEMSLDDKPQSFVQNISRLDYIERRLAIPKSTEKLAPKTKKPARQGITPTVSDELSQYLSAPAIDNPVYKSNPLMWWRDIGAERFPRLSYMATDFLTIASSSADMERTFSSAGRMACPQRSSLRRHIIAMAQCLRSWSKAGLYNSPISADLLARELWEPDTAGMESGRE